MVTLQQNNEENTKICSPSLNLHLLPYQGQNLHHVPKHKLCVALYIYGGSYVRLCRESCDSEKKQVSRFQSLKGQLRRREVMRSRSVASIYTETHFGV